MDKLEKFIVDHKENLEKPRDEKAGWEAIAKALDKREKSIDSVIYWKVAAVIFFISTIALTVLNFRDSNSGSSEMVAMESLEKFYVEQVSLKTKEYLSIADQSQSEDLMKDLRHMDDAYDELKSSFAELESEEMANAMVENLRLRILILNEQIEIIRNGQDREEAFHSS